MMKTLQRKKWFRRLCQTFLVLASLWVLAVAGVNWWGARLKRDAIAQMRAEGRPTSLAEMLTPLPRDEDNFAMIPILAQAREEWWNDKTGDGSIHAGEARAKLAALGAPALRGDRTFGRNGAPDLNRWKEKLQLRGSDAECLETYDRYHGEILGQLRAGLVRPQTISPLLHRRAAEPAFRPLPWGCRKCLEPLVEGLAFRAELALAANRPDVAHESLLILIRLAEMIRGEVDGMGPQYQIVLLARLKPTLTRALESGQLDQGQLASIASQLAVMDPMLLSLRESDLGILETFAIYDNMKERGGDFIHPMRYFDQFPRPSWARNLLPAVDKWFAKVEPGGWYDANAALCGRARLPLRRELGEGPDQGSWLQACERAEAQVKKRYSTWNPWLYRYKDLLVSGTADFRAACRLQTYLQQAQLACELEIYRLDHGRYPDRLEEIKSPATVDSITGEPYRYRTTGAGYLLYSVGADGKDDGGQRDERHRGNDPDWVW